MPAAASLRMDVADSYSAMCRQASELVIAGLKKNPELILCASAGGTPTGVYEYLAARAARHPRLFARMRVVQIDEWCGLPRSSPATCAVDLLNKLVRPLGISTSRFVRFHTTASDPQKECDRMARWLASNGPIDICVLGLGLNGHIAMNEPGPTASPCVHVQTLSKSSRQHAMLKDLPRPPHSGLTLGMKDILSSRLILLLVSGAHKQRALRGLLQPQVTTRFPASFLWTHANARVLCDRAAAVLLPH